MGTESELIARAGVSRALLREAVRLLEHHHIARMRRGPGGGLFVMAPSADAVTETAAIYLARHGMQLSELAELRTGVEVATAGLAAQRIDAEGAELLRRALVREQNGTDAAWAAGVESVDDLHRAVAATAHNRALDLVALVLIRLSPLHQLERPAPKDPPRVSAEVLRAHEGIATAIASGDRERARHRMRRHLQTGGGQMS